MAKGLRSQGAFVYKIPDLARAVVKPFDLCVAYAGNFIPIECKLRKFIRKSSLKASDIILRPFDLHGHQLPTLTKIWKEEQGCPYVAVCAVVEDHGRIIQKRAWMVPVAYISDTSNHTLADLENAAHDGMHWELKWIPGLGWIFPSYRQPKRQPD